MNFLANENFPLFSIRLLRDAGYDVVSISEENPGAKDSEVLKWAHEEDRIILTFDRDYGELIYKHKSLFIAGILYFRFDPFTPEEPADILLKILQKYKLGIVNKFTVVERHRIRQRTFSDVRR